MITSMEATPYKRESNEPEPLSLIDIILEEQKNSRHPVQKFASKVKNVLSYPSEKLKKKWREDYIRRLTVCKGFSQLEEKMSPYTSLMTAEDYKSVNNYISTLLILDQLHSSLKETEVKFPDKLNGLDVGCGRDWFYARGLGGFLQNFNSNKPREVNLDGIDPLLTDKLISRISEEGINPLQDNVLKLERDNHYDFILIHNMLSSQGHFKKFGLEPTNLNEMMEKCSKLLVPEGVQVTIGYQSAGEYFNVVEHIPTERRIAEFNYKVELGNEELDSIFTPGMDRIFRSGICISGK
jgi:hypothetical protein